MRKGMPSNYQIFDYWKNEYINNQTIVEDWGEPNCWSCNVPIIVENETLLKEGNFKEIWNRTSGLLERCHIIPKALGGSNEPDNLFLLCPDCHEESPDTTNPNIFFKWVTNKRKSCIAGIDHVQGMNEVKKYCDTYNVDVNELMEFMSLHNNKIEEGVINTHGVKFSLSSIILYWLERFSSEKELEVNQL